jgi:hypothetical protein
MFAWGYLTGMLITGIAVNAIWYFTIKGRLK